MLAEHLLVPHDTHSPGEAAGGERVTELLADAVPGVSQHDPERDTLRAHAVKFFQGEVALGFVRVEALGHTCQVATPWIVRPAPGQKQSHAERRKHVLVSKGQGDQRLAVGEFPERTTVLVSDTDAMLATLGQSSVVNDQDGVFTATQGLSAFSQEAFEWASVPGADVQEMVEALVVNPQVVGNGLGALPFQRGEQAPDVSGEPGALLVMVWNSTLLRRWNTQVLPPTSIYQ